MKNLLILNDPPYGTERSYNALRLARPPPAPYAKEPAQTQRVVTALGPLVRIVQDQQVLHVSLSHSLRLMA